MRKVILLACCAALVGGISVASAQNTGPVSQMKTNDLMNANAMTMKKRHKKPMTKSDDSMKGMSKDGMSKDGMKKETMPK